MPETLKIKQVLLIVDDSSLVTKRLINILKEVKAIHKVFTAANYPEAVAVLSEGKTDIVLLDIKLPGKNGIDVLKFIVKNYPDIKVVMLSNLVSEYYQRLCKKLGAVYFIDKSKDFDMIPGVVVGL